ncbi:hypothetical protein [Bradyrhizobium sp. sBnM-33]|nr:hypothetical protein [Bradyrhizobium sp. sBnM-33]WOH52674.1 hypothetical protein RX328_11405 [Bradyrhizobium sp. sBnM-33]
MTFIGSTGDRAGISRRTLLSVGAGLAVASTGVRGLPRANAAMPCRRS